MKNIIKKISAFAMAFTLLGAGGSIASNVKNVNTTSLTASAAANHICGQFVCNGHYEWKHTPIYEVIGKKKRQIGVHVDKYWVTECCVCRRQFRSLKESYNNYY